MSKLIHVLTKLFFILVDYLGEKASKFDANAPMQYMRKILTEYNVINSTIYTTVW